MGLDDKRKQARFILDKVGPVKDLFIVLFFVSMGTLINMGAVLNAYSSHTCSHRDRNPWENTGDAGLVQSSRAKSQPAGSESQCCHGENSPSLSASEGAGLGVASQILFPVAGLRLWLAHFYRPSQRDFSIQERRRLSGPCHSERQG